MLGSKANLYNIFYFDSYKADLDNIVWSRQAFDALTRYIFIGFIYPKLQSFTRIKLHIITNKKMLIWHWHQLDIASSPTITHIQNVENWSLFT